MSRDGQNVVTGLGRQIAVADEPVRNTGRTGIVGGTERRVSGPFIEAFRFAEMKEGGEA
jgi:hypothetical protein